MKAERFLYCVRRLGIFISCAMTLLGPSAPLTAQQNSQAASEDSGDDIIMGAALDPTICNSGNAAPLPFEAVVRSKKPLDEPCVAIDGFWLGRALFQTAADANSKLSAVSKDLAARRIGVYGSERLLASAPKRARRYTLIGRLQNCETAWPRAMMVMGYCHYTGGPFLIVSETETRK